MLSPARQREERARTLLVGEGDVNVGQYKTRHKIASIFIITYYYIKSIAVLQ